jgi:hypothetical protein
VRGSSPDRGRRRIDPSGAIAVGGGCYNATPMSMPVARDDGAVSGLAPGRRVAMPMDGAHRVCVAPAARALEAA